MDGFGKRLNWKTIVVLFFFPSVPIYLVPQLFRKALWLSFFNGESSVLFWTQHGVGFWHATLIATGCSTYDLLFWFCLFNWMRKVYHERLVQPHAQINDWIERSNYPWLLRIQGAALRSYRFFVPQKDRIYFLGAPRHFHKGYHFYVPLLYYGSSPGGIWTGIGYTLEFNLNQALAFLIEAAANAFKMLGFGLATVLLAARNPWLAGNPWLVVVAVMTLPLTKKLFEERLKKIMRRTVLQPQPQKTGGLPAP